MPGSPSEEPAIGCHAGPPKREPFRELAWNTARITFPLLLVVLVVAALVLTERNGVESTGASTAWLLELTLAFVFGFTALYSHFTLGDLRPSKD